VAIRHPSIHWASNPLIITESPGVAGAIPINGFSHAATAIILSLASIHSTAQAHAIAVLGGHKIGAEQRRASHTQNCHQCFFLISTAPGAAAA